MAVCHSLNLQLPPFSRLLKWNQFIGQCLPHIVLPFQKANQLVQHSRILGRTLPPASPSPVIRPGAPHRRSIRSYASDAAAQRAQSEPRFLKSKARLDELCVEKFPEYSRTMIQSWILQGKVTVDGKAVFKAGTPVSRVSDINITAEIPRFVCRAGYKLEAAIEHFGCDIKDKVGLYAGLSTGGFTDCLLQYGAAFVYGVEVGYGQRWLKEFAKTGGVMPAVFGVMKPHSTLITLIKPQFEATRSQVGSGGVVRDPEVHKEVVSKVVNGVEGCGFKCNAWIQSPLKGAKATSNS